jgi:anti-sigma-K factor RskA
MIGHERFDDLVAAYAVDAIDAAERPEFEAHLAGCEHCQRALADLRAVSAGLGLAAEPEAPPVSLRARTLARATGQPQEHRAAVAGRIGPRPAANVVTQPWSSSWLLLAASLVALIAMGAYAWTLRTELSAARETIGEMSARAETLRAQLATARLDAARLVNTLSVLRSTDVVRIDLRGVGTAPGATGHAYLSPTRGLVFDAERLPPTATARTYQLWVIPPGANVAPISAGTFDVGRTGTSTVALPLPSGVRIVAAVAVTEEPAGGSAKATTPPILLGTASN